jgi:hypothetical protein
MFALKFGTPELAAEFKESFEAAQKSMQAIISGADDNQGSAEADAAADAIAALDVKSEEKKATESSSPTKSA